MKIKYCLLQGLYWMLFCAGGSFVAAYLTDIGVSAAVIGAMTAIFCAASALLQPVLGRNADRGGKWSWNRQLYVMFGLVLGCNVVLLMQKEHVISCFAFGLIILCMNCAMPFVNGAAFYYKSRGKSINFGVARGTGSLCFAILSLILGRFIEERGINSIAIAGIIMAIVTMLVMLAFPCDDKTDSRVGNINEEHRAPTMSFFKFVKHYPTFMGTLLGFTLLLMFHNITNTYLLQMIQRLGGSSAELGITLSMAAALEIPMMFGFSYLVKKWPVRRLLMVSGVMFSIKAITYVLAKRVMAIYLIQLLQPFSYAIFASASVYYAQEVMDEENKLQGQSLVGSSIAFGAVFGNLLGGVILQEFGVMPMLYSGVIMAVVGALVVLSLNYKK